MTRRSFADRVVDEPVQRDSLLRLMIIMRWRQLDEWDGCLFVAVAAMAMAVALWAGAPTSAAVGVGMSVASLSLAIRRIFQPSVLAAEDGPPPQPRSMFQLLLLSLGFFGVLCTLLALMLVAWFLSEAKDLPAVAYFAFGAVPIVMGLISMSLVYLARRLHRRRQ
jgi:small-conductance mechanosensitive channel